MPIKLLIALVTLITAPLLLLGWVSASTMRTDRAAAQRQIESVFRSRLREIDQSLLKVLDETSSRLADRLKTILVDTEVDFAETVARLSKLERTDPQVRRVVVVNPQGRIAYPPPPASDSNVHRIEDYAAITSLVAARPRSTVEQSSKFAEPPSQKTNQNNPLGSLSDQSFIRLVYHVWYRDEGTQLSLWATGNDRATVGVVLERARWISDLTNALPDTKTGVHNSSTSRYFRSEKAANDEFAVATDATVLFDESNRIIYRWGSDFELSDTPIIEHDLSGPLTSWRLRYYTAAPVIAPLYFTSLYATVASLGVILFFLGAYVLTHLQRQIRLAQHRVTFAGQVSHELRTPLTNIRLFTELAQHDLTENDSSGNTRVANRLAIIDSETRRLSRIVSGVMEVIREDQGIRPLRMMPHHVDRLINEVLLHFTPSYAAAGIEIDRIANANSIVRVDADCLEMILVNLLSNVEKYAATGGHVCIESFFESGKFRMRKRSLLRWLQATVFTKSPVAEFNPDGRTSLRQSQSQTHLQSKTDVLEEMNLVVLIRDRGPGVAAIHRHVIFKPFRRLDDSVSAPSGTGIGLTIARRVARRHGGDVTLVPTPQGACFKVEVRVLPCPSSSAAETGLSRSAPFQGSNP